MAIYYIDNKNGNIEADGLSPENAVLDYLKLDVNKGDTVLFKRGIFYRAKLQIKSGATYGAYGEGDLPTFCGSTDVSSASDWQPTDKENVWKCTKVIPGDVGNYVFNEDDCTATFRWDKDGLCAQGDFWDSRFANGEQYRGRYENQEVLLYSVGNPADVYSHIECVSYNTRQLGTLCEGVTLESIRFINSGVHALAGQGNNITVRGCSFENIGGCGWNRDLRIRFGNGFEIWHFGNNIMIENCQFKNVYDSCVTHQGPGEATEPTKNFICRNNVFDTYGMAAFEYRDKMPIDSSFTGNVCKNAGCGFAMLGEELPRRSEIWPQPMGHHIFLWRIPHATDGGSLVIEDNIFGEAPVGAAIYSIISKEAEAQMVIDNNQYTRNDVLLNRFGEENFSDLELYKSKTGKDLNSRYI